jgi:UDP-N-acetylglucosamine:LPS N-acetylglucosamine transferase
VTALLSDPQRLERMREAMARLARPDAAKNLASLVAEMAGACQAVAA